MAGGRNRRQNPSYNNYKTIIGTVTAVLNRYKGVIEFQDHGIKQRALLKVEKLSCKPHLNPDGLEHPINYFVGVGTSVKSLCHKFDETGEHKCGWYVAEVIAVGLSLTDPILLNGVCPTMVNKVGVVSQIDRRQGVITCVDEYDNKHDILFLASKLYISGRRVNVKQTLYSILDINDKIYFDAVPLDSEENNYRFSWIATVAWKHNKPRMDYNRPVNYDGTSLSIMRPILRNPRSQFIRGKGQILRILNSEYGIAFGVVNDHGNHWQSVLFHRSNVSVFKFNLKDSDLRAIFKKGDKIRFIAAAAPSGFNTQWVASYIGVDVVGAARNAVNNTVYVRYNGAPRYIPARYNRYIHMNRQQS